MNGFAQLIADRRGELDLSIDEVAAAIGRSAVVLEAWEKGRTFPEDPGIAVPLAEVLRLPSALLTEAYAQSSPHPVLTLDEVAPAPGEAFAAFAEGVVADVGASDGLADVGASDGLADVGASDGLADSGSTGQVGETEITMASGLDGGPVGPYELDPSRGPGALSAEGPGLAAAAESITPTTAPAPVTATDLPGGHRAAYEPPVASHPDPAPVAPKDEGRAADSDFAAKLLALASVPYIALVGRFKRRRWTARAPTSLPSYVEDRKQRTTYQLRAIFTGVAVLLMVLLIRWTWGQFADAFGSLWQTLLDAV